MAARRRKSVSRTRAVNEATVREILVANGIDKKAAAGVTDGLETAFELGQVERVRRLESGLIDWLQDNATEGRPFACSTTDLILALQHVSYKVFDSMRSHDVATNLLDFLAEARRHAAEHTQPATETEPDPEPAKPKSKNKKDDAPSEFYG